VTHDVESCPGCRPVMIDLSTGKVVPDNDPRMVTMNRVYDSMTPAHRMAWHRVTCLNSRQPTDVALAQEMLQKFKREGMN
jgi:hypothetical protein